MIVGEDAPFHEWFVAKEQHEAELHSRVAQVVEELLLPAGIELTSGFILEEDDGLDQRVGSVMAA